MRLSENKIKAAILDTDLEIRQRAIRYFSKSYSTDLSVMPLVIEAVETFGRHDAYHLIGLSRDLPQTEETIAWIIDELNNEESDQHENYTYNLSIVLVRADPALLLLRESDILDLTHFIHPLHGAFTERLQMLSWDMATCWQKLGTASSSPAFCARWTPAPGLSIYFLPASSSCDCFLRRVLKTCVSFCVSFPVFSVAL